MTKNLCKKRCYQKFARVFSRTRWAFHRHNFWAFSRVHISVSRVDFALNFHGHFEFFTECFFSRAENKKFSREEKKHGKKCGFQKILGFCSKFFRTRFRWYKCAEFWKICEKLFLSENIPTNFQKVGVLWLNFVCVIGVF